MGVCVTDILPRSAEGQSIVRYAKEGISALHRDTVVDIDKVSQRTRALSSRVQVVNMVKIPARGMQKSQYRKVINHDELIYKLSIISVKVQDSNGDLIPTYAFVNNGSTTTFCWRDFLG